MTVQLPEPPQLFARFDSDNNSDGAARERFEQFVSDLVAVQHLDASTVAASNHTDWGIDTFIGNLGGGDVRIWQSKYFREWQDTGPQNNVRKSFASAQSKALEHKYRIIEWTLVVPAILHPAQMKWFQGWASRTQRATGVRIALWTGDKLRQRLMSAEAMNVRREYFPHTLDAPSAADAVAPVAMADDYSMFEDALFVRQMHAAGYTETGAARGMFFATDALRRDLQAKRASEGLQALRTVQLSVQGAWETRFNEHAPTANASGLMPKLYGAVLADAATVPDAPGLRLQHAHKQGAAHILVEEQKAGWVKHWRDVADGHTATRESIATDASAGREPSTALPAGTSAETDHVPVETGDIR
ncbi:hypothetical protein HUN58_02210 [Curtobacterium sp. Csp1]|uniref:hypothetical protein n=1 Tax=Curtobacterium sp. Csp1 TaxID=2495429 RepID=UPI00159856F8|nr:hypothetical protein [Curtobacterium sp. Csp1]QKS18873.1 hypothetical protein HUN58_02210 [Curtobacterium sp. Csp1]